MIRNQQYQSYILLVSEELKKNVKCYEKNGYDIRRRRHDWNCYY